MYKISAGIFCADKAKNVGIAKVIVRLFNTDMGKYFSKIMDQLNRHWYKMLLTLSKQSLTSFNCKGSEIYVKLYIHYKR